jgi:hypothetical protein
MYFHNLNEICPRYKKVNLLFEQSALQRGRDLLSREDGDGPAVKLKKYIQTKTLFTKRFP